MKFLHLTYHFEYAPRIEEILDEHDPPHYVRYSMMQGKDSDGKHFGDQVHPGNVSIVQAQVPDEDLDALLADLKEFRDEKKAHEHLEAVVLPVERRL